MAAHTQTIRHPRPWLPFRDALMAPPARAPRVWPAALGRQRATAGAHPVLRQPQRGPVRGLELLEPRVRGRALAGQGPVVRGQQHRPGAVHHGHVRRRLDPEHRSRAQRHRLGRGLINVPVHGVGRMLAAPVPPMDRHTRRICGSDRIAPPKEAIKAVNKKCQQRTKTS